MGMSTGGGGRAPLSEINVTPLVDVMLVLLIIFMVAAPMMTTGVDIDLPQTQAERMDQPGDAMVLSINKKRELFLSGKPLPSAELFDTLRSNAQLQEAQEVYVEADASVPYGFVVMVFAQVKAAGIKKVGLITDPSALTFKEAGFANPDDGDAT